MYETNSHICVLVGLFFKSHTVPIHNCKIINQYVIVFNTIYKMEHTNFFAVMFHTETHMFLSPHTVSIHYRKTVVMSEVSIHFLERNIHLDLYIELNRQSTFSSSKYQYSIDASTHTSPIYNPR